MNCRPTYDSTLPLSGYVLSSAGRLTSSVAKIQKEVERLGGTFQSKIDENVGIVISSQGEINSSLIESIVSSLKMKCRN